MKSILTFSSIEKTANKHKIFFKTRGNFMARKKKKKSGFQKLTIVMAWLMAVITLAAVIASAVEAMVSAGWL